MPDWDEDSPRLRQNLAKLLRRILADARKRLPLDSESVRRWHAAVMQGLNFPPNAPKSFAGKFRGEHGIEDIGVQVAGLEGVPPAEVAGALAKFDSRLRQSLAQLDQWVTAGALPTSDLLPAVLDVCAWAHAEWVRVHPFANGNGRTARLLANAIAMRYGVPPFVRLRPRPDGDYGTACEAAMRGNWRPTVSVFSEMLMETLER
ncbi:MAG TPA: Fic family protein [Chthoniobacteraceae bacterium]|jgi:fido (protein-threonine AMPylation protein)|nr:Fic family protein [Chthoniobacteraceae bacterium]